MNAHPLMKACRPLLAIALLSMLSIPGGARADERILQFMEDRWTHGILRQVGDEAVGNPIGLGKADCVETRALDRRQRNLARRIGQTLERSGIHVDLIATSAWCRAIETARTLKLRPVTVEPALNASTVEDTEAADRTLELLDSLRRSETALLVTHAGNIRALTNRQTKPGEIVVVRVRPGQDLEVIGAFVPD